MKATSLGQLLKQRREQLGFSRTRAAHLSGVNASSIEAWEVGRVSRPAIHDVLRLARVLSIPMDELERSVLEDAGTGEREPGSPSVSDSARGSQATPASLFGRATALLGWSDEQALAAFDTSAQRIAQLREGEAELSVLEVLTLIAALARTSSGARGTAAPEVEAVLARLALRV